MKLEENLVFRRLKMKRTLIGFVSGALSWGVLFLLLGVENTVDLSSKWGSHLSWHVWSGQGVLWLITIASLMVATLFVNSHGASKNTIQLFPITDREQPNWLKDPEKIRKMVLDIAAEMSVSVEMIYVQDEPEPNAFASLVWNQGDVIVLYRNLIDILDDESLRAVIAHELAHISQNDVLYRLHSVLPKLLIRWLMIVTGLRLGGILLLSTSISEALYRFIGLILFLVSMSIIIALVQFFENWYSQIKEGMADVTAAFWTSMEGSINFLLRINARSHTLSLFQRTLSKAKVQNLNADMVKRSLQFFPVGTVDEQDILTLAPKSYAKVQLLQILQVLQIKVPPVKLSSQLDDVLVHLSSYHDPSVDAPEASKEDSLEEQVEEAVEPVDSSTDLPIPFVWNVFDANGDGFLQADEIAQMLNALKENPSALRRDEGGGSHPQVRDRILLIAEAFQDRLSGLSSESI